MLLDVSPVAGPGGAVANEGGTRDRSGKPRTATGSGGPATTDEQAELTSGLTETATGADRGDDEKQYRETVYDAMVVALSGRIYLDETVDLTPEQVLRQIWEDHFILDPASAAPG